MSCEFWREVGMFYVLGGGIMSNFDLGEFVGGVVLVEIVDDVLSDGGERK